MSGTSGTERMMSVFFKVLLSCSERPCSGRPENQIDRWEGRESVCVLVRESVIVCVG